MSVRFVLFATALFAAFAATQATGEESSAGEAGNGRAIRPYLGLTLQSSEDLPATLSQTGAFEEMARRTPRPGFLPYEVNVSFWSDGADKRRWIGLPADAEGKPTRIGFSASGPWRFPPGTVFLKTFERDDRPIETRLLFVTEGGVVGGSYRWRKDGSDADLETLGRSLALEEEAKEGSPAPTWYFPSSNDCSKCHLPSAGGVLGGNSRQLNRIVFAEEAEPGNQLQAWRRVGLFDPPPSEEELRACDRLCDPADETAPLEQRVRSYLDVNCGYCHRPGGAVADFDARFENESVLKQLVDAPARIDFGVDRAKLVAPHDAWRSIALHRMKTQAPTKMPPLSRETVDPVGTKLMEDWIASLPGSDVVAPPAIEPAGADFRTETLVRLTHPDPDAQIHYTLDGTPPIEKSPVYAGPIVLKESATLRARAYKQGATRSVPVHATFLRLPDE